MSSFLIYADFQKIINEKDKEIASLKSRIIKLENEIKNLKRKIKSD